MKAQSTKTLSRRSAAAESAVGRATVLELSDGARAELRDGALELRDAQGLLLVRYADGAAEITAATRDLKLVAPKGKVVLEAGTDVVIAAARDVEQRAGRRLALDVAEGTQRLELAPQRTHLHASRLEVEAKESRVAAGVVTILARSIATTAERLAQTVEHYELTATKVVEKTRDVLREASGLAQSRFGRARTIVTGIYSLHTRRSVLISKQDTTIDGERILLG